MLKSVFFTTALAFSAPALLLAQAAPSPDTIVVLDVSNSMWGQIDGVSKIEIAREVIADLMGDIDPNARFGLVAYGHREKANCQDIELVLPVGPLDAAAFSAAVNSLTPRGRTPLTEAVRQAAEVLNYRDSPSRIILVSDGLESCNADPCALAAELARGGVDFTAHVVGFDVAGIEDQSQLSCLADQTGGLYLTADSTEELTAALTTMMVEASAPPPTPAPAFSVIITAPAEVETSATFEATWQATARQGDQIVLISENGEVFASLNATNGPPASFTAPAVIGQYAVVYRDSDGEALSRAAVTVVQKVSLSGPETAIAGTPVQISWEGPGADRDFVTIVPVGARVNEYTDYAYVEEGSPVTLNAPDKVGAFEIRYVSANSTSLLAMQPITLTAPTVSLGAADTANAGSQINVRWVGPNNERDFITIVQVGARDGAYNSYAYTAEGSPAAITTPDTAGTYEIRYVSGQSNATLARRLITVEEVDVTLNAVATAMAGSVIEITWKGPNAARDFITIVAPDAREGAYKGYAYTTDGATIQVQSLDMVGNYEIRYVSGQSSATLARRPLSLTAPTILMEPQGTVLAGMPFTVGWLGPDNARDYLSIAVIGSADRDYISYAYTQDGTPANFTAPAGGNYELRYVSGQSETVLERMPLAVAAN